ncbi:Cytosolic carboxypeptidase 6 [Halotydeus destructor]|nr:Cytosolic carboxypeptidase 6 [Halotydeus destructor]
MVSIYLHTKSTALSVSLVALCRTSIVGADLNRVWGTPSPIMHPEVALAKAAIAEIVARHGDNVDTYLDIHARCDMLGAFVSGKKYDDVYRMERHVLLPKLLSKIAHDFYIESTVYASVPLTSGTPRRGLGSILLEATNSYTLQVSCHGFYDKSTLGHRVIPYTEERYLKLGSNLGLAILDSYVTIGLVHLGPSSNQVSSMLSRKADTARNKTPEQEGENGHTFKLLHPFSKLTLQTSQAEENARKHSKAKREEEGERTNNDN